MTPLSHPWLRVAGVGLAAAVVFVLDTQSESALHGLWLPLLLVLAAYMMTQAPMAVAFATFAMALAHSDFVADGWIQSRAYPLLAAAGLGVCGYIGWQRFRQRIAATHDARWAGRTRSDGDGQPPT